MHLLTAHTSCISYLQGIPLSHSLFCNMRILHLVINFLPANGEIVEYIAVKINKMLALKRIVLLNKTQTHNQLIIHSLLS